MASGGMDWAYRMMAEHDLDPLGGMIVMHLGWRDHPDQRTDRGIARALCQHRKSVQLATAKLVALGVIERRSGQWVAVETIKIVEGAADARRPVGTTVSGDGEVSSPSPRRRSEFAVDGEVSSPQKAKSLRHNEKEKIEKGRALARPAFRPDIRKLTGFQRDRIERGEPVLVDGMLVKGGTLEAAAIVAALDRMRREPQASEFAESR